MMKLVALALAVTATSAFVQPAPQKSSTARFGGDSAPINELEVGVQAPAGFFDPLGWCETQPEGFERRRAVERKHGRIAMVAVVGNIVHNADIEFPGYISNTENVKFSDISNGFTGFFQIPTSGLLQIFVLTAFIELAWWPANNYSGDYGVGFFGKQYEDPEERLQKLNAEMANGRLAMLGIFGAMFAEGSTGMTLQEQLGAGRISPFDSRF